MKVNKGVGPNSIPTKILKDYKSELSKPLRDMINTSFTTGIFPSALKVANIIPIHKKVDKLDCNNYQPISLLSNISKIFEKMMHIEMQFLRIMQVSWIKIKFFHVFSLAFEINIPHTIPLLVSPKWFDQHLTIISSRVMYLSVYRKHLIL